MRYSYDEVAADFDRFAVPLLFLRPASDLVSLAGAPAGGRLLDVGAGSGVASLVASRAMGAAGVVAVDASPGMLRIARQKGLACAVCAAAPGLPFPAASFDRVIGNFVINHFPDRGAALSDMVRVLRPRGTLGVTAWAAGQSEPRTVWSAVAAAAVGQEALDRFTQAGVPSENWFADPQRLGHTLRDAGLANIRVEQRVYETAVTISEFLATRNVSMQARAVLAIRGPQGFAQFRREAEDALRTRFREPLEDVREVYFGLGTKPAP